MAIELTPEQERRIRAVVDAGGYSSAYEALDAAVAGLEAAAVPGFEGSTLASHWKSMRHTRII